MGKKKKTTEAICEEIYLEMKKNGSEAEHKKMDAFIKSCKNPELKRKLQQTKIAARVASKASKEEFIAFLRTGELPAVKLNKQEMEYLKGAGWLPFNIFGGSTMEVSYSNRDKTSLYYPDGSRRNPDRTVSIPYKDFDYDWAQKNRSFNDKLGVDMKVDYKPSIWKWTSSLFSF